jgi:hypothetical protein
VEQLLLGRLDGLDAARVAAFVSGWSSALELVRRTDLTLPRAPKELEEAIAKLVSAIEAAQRAALADPDDHPSG